MYDNAYRDDPPPRRDLLPRRSFLTTSSLIATRGCHNRCGFCYLATDGLRMPYRVRDVEQVARRVPRRRPALRRLRRQQPRLAAGLPAPALPGAARRSRRSGAPALTIDVTDDPSLVREMALAGCTGVFIGFESLSDENLREARKRTPRTEDYARRVAILHDHGIQVNGSFVLGFDHDRRDVFVQTAEWIEENRLECATFHILTPYPGTPLFRQMEAEGRLLHRDWSLYDTAHVVFRPKQMTRDGARAGLRLALPPALLARARSGAAARATGAPSRPYLAMSYLYKRSNRFWHFLIRHRLTSTVWRPLVELTRRRHLKFRRDLSPRRGNRAPARGRLAVTPGV